MAVIEGILDDGTAHGKAKAVAVNGVGAASVREATAADLLAPMLAELTEIKKLMAVIAAKITS